MPFGYGIKTTSRPIHTSNRLRSTAPINQMLLQRTHADNAQKALEILQIQNPTIHRLYQDLKELIGQGRIKFKEIDELSQWTELGEDRRKVLIKIIDRKLTNPKKYGQD